MDCIHADSGVQMYDFAAPYIGMVHVCWDCRRAIAMRTIEKPYSLVPIDCGRIGYGCKKCGGTFTSDDAMTCICPERKEECGATKIALQTFFAYQELTNRRYK